MSKKVQMTKRQKAAKKANKKQGTCTTIQDVAMSHIEYRMVGVIEPECFDVPAPPFSSGAGAENDSDWERLEAAFLEENAYMWGKTTEDRGLLAPSTEISFSTVASSSVSTGITHPKIPSSSNSLSQITCSTLAGDLFENETRNYTASLLPACRPVPPALAIATCTLQVAQTFDASRLQLLLLGQTTDMISARLLAWTRYEITKQYRMEARSLELKSRHQSSPQADSELSPECGALVPYYDPSSLGSVTDEKKVHIPNARTSQSSLDVFMGSRIFLVGDGNLITCIDYGQPLYNVDAMQDDGGSDFDSIASPTKPDLRQVFNCSPNSKSKLNYNITLPIIEISKDEEEDWESRVEQCNEWRDEDDQDSGIAVDSPTGSDDTSSVGILVQYSADLYPSVQAPTSKDRVSNVAQILGSTTSNEPFPEDLQDIHLDTHISSFDPLQNEAINTTDAAEWACELTRMRLGTESLFAFLTVLEVQDNGHATIISVVTAFLDMVDLEREKRGAALLPSTCTAQRVLNSLILPHTILLGTTTVDEFMKELRVDGNGEIEVVDVYGAWDRLGRKDMRLQHMASRGVMGRLGRVLGKLSTGWN
ncbi:hypothetical protein GMOD_00008319 [Pyrenophora seminiperda CCB06]|uniref:Uncharacterized protein n=1 Tax=Pyrenophora seminiperda CCB06 TaxID=1302712 RepID=A0A3M7M268_9PLEO|nr:hypothetical protein GMOD_00008319 [Pyrenophora seminiperda CCB06]